MVYLELFLAFLQIGLFGFGGGYAALPLIQNQVVVTHHWLTLREFADVVTLSQMTPGPIAVNASTFVGTRIAGPLGAMIATAGCILPSCLIMFIFALVYKRYQKQTLLKGVMETLRPVVVGLIGSAAVSLILLSFFGTDTFHKITSPDWIAVLLFAASFFALRKWKISPMLLMGCGGVAGLVFYGVLQL